MDHNIIYKLIDDVKDSLSEHLAPSVSQRVTGEAEISQVFEITIKRQKLSIAGCKVRNGMMQRARKVRVLRGQDIVYDGKYHWLSRILRLHWLTVSTYSRLDGFSEERQEGRDRNAQRHRMWY